MITYRSDNQVDFHLILSLYENAKWTNYTSNAERLKKGIQKSLFLLTAWHNEKLVGILRAIGDEETIIYIQDIIVLDSYQKQGIGKTLITMTLDQYIHVRQIVLLTDQDSGVIAFYEKMGLVQSTTLSLTTFIRT